MRDGRGLALRVAVLMAVLTGCAGGVTGEPTTTTVDRASSVTTTTEETHTAEAANTAPTLSDLSLPGMNLDEPAGEYGWTGQLLGSRGWMHRVIEEGSQIRQTQLVFAVENDCFARAQGAEPTAVTVAGLETVYLEPYDGDTGYWNQKSSSGGHTTGAYALPIGDRTLCVYLRWDPATTEEELAAARQIVETIRGLPFGEYGIRINFMLPAGWDTG